MKSGWSTSARFVEVRRISDGRPSSSGNDRANSTAERLGRGMVTVVPLTSNVSRVFPFHVLLHAATTGPRADSKAQAEQVRSVAVERLGPALSQLPSDIMHEVDEALRLHLQL